MEIQAYLKELEPTKIDRQEDRHKKRYTNQNHKHVLTMSEIHYDRIYFRITYNDIKTL